MNKDTARYRRALKKQLRCGASVRRQILTRFDDSLVHFEEEFPSPTYAQLETAFGPPPEMAAVLMEGISDRETQKYAIRKKLIRIFAGIAAALFIAFTIYVYFFKDITYISYDEAFPTPTSDAIYQEDNNK